MACAIYPSDTVYAMKIGKAMFAKTVFLGDGELIALKYVMEESQSLVLE